MFNGTEAPLLSAIAFLILFAVLISPGMIALYFFDYDL
jgi:hypothetical protein